MMDTEVNRNDTEMTVLVVEPEKKPYVKTISNGLSSLQHEVGGSIEAVYPFEDEVALVMNENGKLDGLPLNRALYDNDGHIYDVIAGTFLVVGLGEEDFDSLTDRDVEKFSALYAVPQMFMKLGERIVALPIPSEAPLYPHSAAYAREHGELEAYRQSLGLNIACKNDIEIAIRDNYRNDCLDGAAATKSVIDRYGWERTAFVMANTVRCKDWDGRISPKNIEWARSMPSPDGKGCTDFRYVIESHPGLTDLFVTRARKEFEPKKESVLDKLRQPVEQSVKPKAARSIEPER